MKSKNSKKSQRGGNRYNLSTVAFYLVAALIIGFSITYFGNSTNNDHDAAINKRAQEDLEFLLSDEAPTWEQTKLKRK